MENVITLSKLIGLCCCAVPPPLYFGLENSKNTRNELARPVMGTIFLVSLNFGIYFQKIYFNSFGGNISKQCYQNDNV